MEVDGIIEENSEVDHKKEQDYSMDEKIKMTRMNVYIANLEDLVNQVFYI